MSSLLCPIFRRSPKIVDFFKSEIFGIFAVFKIDRADVSTIMEAYESIDTGFTRTINIPTFVKEFCGDYGYLFRIIWYKYIKAYRENGSLAEKYGVAGAVDSKSGDEAADQIDPHNPNYFVFTCFLLFIFSVDNKDVNRLVYWMWYKIDNTKIGYPELCQAIEDVWGKNVKFKEQVHDYKETVIKSIKNLDTDPMTPHKFQLADWKFKTCWSAPVVNMLVAIKLRFCGVKFWAKLAPNYNTVCEMSVTEIRTDLSKQITLQNEKSGGGYVDNGERHTAKTKMRRYFKFVHSYWTMGKGEKSTLEDGASYFVWIDDTARWFRRVRAWRIHPSGSWWFGGLKEHIYETYVETDVDRTLRLKVLNDMDEGLKSNFMSFKLKENISADDLTKKMHDTEKSSLIYLDSTVRELTTLPPINFELLENGLDPQEIENRKKTKPLDMKRTHKKYAEIEVEDDEEGGDEDREETTNNNKKNRRRREDDDDISSIGDNTVY